MKIGVSGHDVDKDHFEDLADYMMLSTEHYSIGSQRSGGTSDYDKSNQPNVIHIQHEGGREEVPLSTSHMNELEEPLTNSGGE